MATPYMTAVRTAMQGVQLAAGRWLLSPAAGQCLRPLRVSPAASLCCSRTEPQRSTQPRSTDNKRAREEEEEEEEPEGPEYIPRRNAKNPMRVVAFAWMIGLPTGILTFFLTKREVDKNRLKQLKIRQRMKMSNEGEYESSRYNRHPAQDVKVDQ